MSIGKDMLPPVLSTTTTTTTAGSTDKTTESLLGAIKSFASKTYDFIKHEVPVNVRLLLNENPKKFALFALTCIATSAAVIVLAAAALAVFSTGNPALSAGIAFGAVAVAFAGCTIAAGLLMNDVSDLQDKNSGELRLEYNKCKKENTQIKEEIKIFKEQYKELKKQESSTDDSLKDIKNKITEQKQKIKSNSAKMMRITIAVEKQVAEDPKIILNDTSLKIGSKYTRCKKENEKIKVDINLLKEKVDTIKEEKKNILKKLDDDNISLETEKSNKFENKISEYDVILTEINSEITENKQNLKDKSAQIKTMEKEYSKDDLSNEKSPEHFVYNTYKEKNKQLNKRVNLLEQELNQKEAIKDSYSKELNITEEQITKEREIKGFDEEYNKLKSEDLLLDSSLTTINSKITEKKQKIKANSVKMMNMETEVNKFVAQYAQDILKNISDA